MDKKVITVPIHSDSGLIVSGIYRFSEFMQFAAWFATPRQFRDPQTQKEFAESVGVCEDTLTDWKRHPQFWTLVQQALADWIKDRIPDVVGGLYTKAIEKGNAKEVEMFLRLAGREVNKTK